MERANRSIHQLKCALREVDATVEEEALDPPTSVNVENEDSGVAWHELQHSHAVNQLKALLRQQASKDNEMSPPRRRKMSLPPSECEDSSMPSLHNLVPIINDQSQYIHHLEAEVKFCKDELSGMKNRVQVIVLENERLQQELKSQRQEETLREQTLLDASGNIQDSWIKTGEDSRVDEAAKRPFSHGDAEIGKTTSIGDAEKWKLELERLKFTYEAKSDLLESQLTLLRKDLVEYQKTCEDLRERLKHKESLLAAGASSRVGGLCLKCAQHEAVLSQTHSNVHVQTIETLTKERDDLMSALVSVRSSLAEVQQRETSAYKQVKHAVQMTEEASFEKTKAMLLLFPPLSCPHHSLAGGWQKAVHQQRSARKEQYNYTESLTACLETISISIVNVCDHPTSTTWALCGRCCRRQRRKQCSEDRHQSSRTVLGFRMIMAKGNSDCPVATIRASRALHLASPESSTVPWKPVSKWDALIQCEQLKSELERQTERLEKELAAQQEKRAFEKEMIKKEVAKEREDAESKILILSQNIAKLEAQVETVTREKVSAVSQLEDVQSRLASQEADVSKVCGEMRFQLNKTKMEKDEAEKEHREYKAKSQRDLEIKDELM
ncbi:hypothetical protein U0070_019159 [Myodes glareolus]|uniref:Serologically defined colon cancer antigen 8 n=1 Tax=Myodes glareolus TaxID=447135 RepID=A0AAW0IKZ6_MYOGA